MSPARSITAPSSRLRTAVPAVSLVVIVVASLGRDLTWVMVGAHHELEHVMGAVAALVSFVDHVLDQEQPPAPRSLQTLELRLDVRHLRLVVLAGPTQV